MIAPTKDEPKPAPQYRHKARVDIRLALRRSADTLFFFWPTVAYPDAPPFAGGVLTDWPSRLAEELVICRAEWAAVQAYLREEEARVGHST